MLNNEFRALWNASVTGKGFKPEDFDRGLNADELENVYQTAIRQARQAQYAIDLRKAA